jgi:hypothetical protein
MQLVARHGLENSPDLRQRRAARARQVDNPRAEVLLDHSLDRERGLGRLHGEPIDIQIVVANGDLPRELLQKNLGIGSAQAQRPQIDRIVDRRVLEAGIDVQSIDAARGGIRGRPDSIVDLEAAVGDADRWQRNRTARTFAVRLAPLRLDQPAEIPALRIAVQMDGGGGDRDPIEHDPL